MNDNHPRQANLMWAVVNWGFVENPREFLIFFWENILKNVYKF
jgi:hypothetical protein